MYTFRCLWHQQTQESLRINWLYYVLYCLKGSNIVSKLGHVILGRTTECVFPASCQKKSSFLILIPIEMLFFCISWWHLMKATVWNMSVSHRRCSVNYKRLWTFDLLGLVSLLCEPWEKGPFSVSNSMMWNYLKHSLNICTHLQS